VGTAWLISLKRTMRDEERWAGGETANVVLPGRPDCLGREVPTLIIADGTILAPGGGVQRQGCCKEYIALPIELRMLADANIIYSV